MNTNVLKSELALHEMTVAELAAVLSMSKAAMYRKLSGKSEFTRLEIAKIVQVLGLTEDKMMGIFLQIRCPKGH